MKTAIVLESDRIVSECIDKELSKHGFDVVVVVNAEDAIYAADKNKPDVVVSDLAVSGHSGSEFLYEFRTYSDWKNVPIIIFSSVNVSLDILSSNDFKMLNVFDFLYKPKTSLDALSKRVLIATS